MNDSLLLTIHVFSCCFMTGLIWFVQIVHYPLMLRVRDGFEAYERAHMNRTTFVVLPAMFAELITGALLWRTPLAETHRAALIAASALLALIWASTFAIQSPTHAKLAGGWDEKNIQFLVVSNWFRTIAWTVRAVLVLGAFLQAGSRAG